MQKINYKKIAKPLGWILGGLAFVYILITLGFNYWLHHNLPRLIKEKLPYSVSYRHLDVDLFTGNIAIHNIAITNKKEYREQLGISGNIEQLEIKNFSIWEAIKNKVIHSDKVYFEKPNLNIRLPKDSPTKDGHQKLPLFFKNVRLHDGNINVIKHDLAPMLSVKELNLRLSNLQLTEKDIKQKLPIVFDDYSISGKYFTFTDNNLYQIKAAHISSEDRRISIQNFSVKPLLSVEKFQQSHPTSSAIYEIDIQNMDFKNIVLNPTKLTLSEISLNKPRVVIKEIPHLSQDSQKASSFSLPVELAMVNVIYGSIKKYSIDGKKSFSIANLNGELQKITANTASKNLLPFHYGQFKINADSIEWEGKASLKAKKLVMDDKNLLVNNLDYLSEGQHIHIPKTELLNYKLAEQEWNIYAQKLNIINAQGAFDFSDANKKKQEISSSKKQKFSVDLGQLNFVNNHLKLKLSKNKEALNIHNINLKINHLKTNSKQIQQRNPLQYQNFQGSVQNFKYQPNHFSELSFSLLKFDERNITLQNFAFLPTRTRKDFLKSLRVQEDLYTVKIPHIALHHYQWKHNGNNSQLVVDQLNIDRLFMNIFSYNGASPPPDKKARTFFNEKLRNIKLPFLIKETKITNASLEYEETDDQALAPGKLSFSQMNLDIHNLNSGKIYPKNSVVSIRANTLFFKTAPTHVTWNFDVNNLQDSFSFKAEINQLKAEAINSFTQPYLHVASQGNIERVILDFKGNKKQISGTFVMRANGLKVNILNKNNQQKRKFLSSLANLFIPKKDKNIPESVSVQFERTEKRSFFNLLWRGIEQGLEQSLLGDRLLRKIEKAKKTIEKINTIEKNIEQKVSPKENKKGFFKNLFNKREKE